MAPTAPPAPPPPAPRRWAWLWAQLGAQLLALLGALALFTNRAELGAQLGALARWWLPLGGALALAALHPRLRRPATVAVAGLLGLSLALLVQRPGQEGFRVLLQPVLLWGPLALLAGLPWLLRRWRQLLLALGGLGVALVALAALGPLLVARFAMPLYNLDLDHRPKPQAGWRNQHGVSPDLPPSEYREEDFVILFLGDSFTEGLYLDDWRDAFPFQVETLLRAAHPQAGVRVVNFGWTGSSPVLQERQLEELGAAYRPDLVVQCFDMTDFHDDLRYAEQLAAKGMDPELDLTIFRTLGVWFSWTLGLSSYADWLEARLPLQGAEGQAPAASPHLGLARFFPVDMPLPAARHHMALSWTVTRRIARSAERLGADYALVVLPRYQQFDPRECPEDWEAEGFTHAGDRFLDQPFAWFEERAQEADFPVWPLLESFRQDPRRPKCFVDDPHYNETGHRVAAEAISERILALERIGR